MTDAREIQSDASRSSPHPGRGQRRFNSGMSSADHDHIKRIQGLNCRRLRLCALGRTLSQPGEQTGAADQEQSNRTRLRDEVRPATIVVAATQEERTTAE